MLRWLGLIGLYLAAGVALLVAANADQGGSIFVPFLVLVAASVVLGWGTGRSGLASIWVWVLIPWLLIPLGLPFGDTNKFTGGDDTDAVALLAVVPALFSMLVILIAGGGRILYDRRRRRHRHALG
jgi:hypothetical protein